MARQPGTYDPKTPFEQYAYTMDFAALLGQGETIATMTVTIEAIGGGDVTGMLVGAATISGSIAGQVVGGGAANTCYKLRFQGVTSSNNKIEQDGILPVLDTILGEVAD